MTISSDKREWMVFDVWMRTPSGDSSLFEEFQIRSPDEASATKALVRLLARERPGLEIVRTRRVHVDQPDC